MNSNKLTGAVMAITILGMFLTAYPNPESPTQYLVLSEVQVVDSSHWTVEFLFANYFHTVTLLADTFTYDYSLVNKSIDTSIHPKIPVKQNGYGLITPQQYPTLRLHPGDTVWLHMNNWGDWACVIDSSLKPTQSMAAYQWCNPLYYSGPDVPYVEWCIDASPTIGYANDSTGIWGCLKGFVCDKDSNPIPNFEITYYDPRPGIRQGFESNLYTDSNGCFFFSKLLSGWKFSFNCESYCQPADYTFFRPFSVEPECTLYVTLKCDSSDYTSARITAAQKRSPLRILNIVQQKHAVLFAFNGNSEDYIVSVFSANGRVVFNSRISNSGPGTYSTVWNSGVRPGTYIARVCSQSFSAEKRFIVK